MMLMSTTCQVETSFNAYKMTSKQALIKYLHQCLFSPPKSTLIHALEQNYFPTWPGFTAAAVKQYLPDAAPATDKGQMQQQRKGLRSTSRPPTDDQTPSATTETLSNFHPPMAQEENNQFFVD
jgi:hypothetical protein